MQAFYINFYASDKFGENFFAFFFLQTRHEVTSSAEIIISTKLIASDLSRIEVWIEHQCVSRYS